MNSVTLKFDNDKIKKLYFGELSVLTITPNCVEMHFDNHNDELEDIADGVCKYTFKHEIKGVEVFYD